MVAGTITEFHSNTVFPLHCKTNGWPSNHAVHEAWLRETKPTVEALWNKPSVITEEERRSLVDLFSLTTAVLFAAT